jgi:hypothetical protein
MWPCRPCSWPSKCARPCNSEREHCVLLLLQEHLSLLLLMLLQLDFYLTHELLLSAPLLFLTLQEDLSLPALLLCQHLCVNLRTWPGPSWGSFWAFDCPWASFWTACRPYCTGWTCCWCWHVALLCWGCWGC